MTIPLQARGFDLRQRAERVAAGLPPLLVQAERVATTVAQGVHGRRRVGVGESFWQFRPYQTGDTSTQIDWRQSAKRERLFIRQNEWEAAESVWFWRDSSNSMDWRSRYAEITKRDRAEVLLLALASLLVRGGERIALLGDGLAPSASRITLDRFAQTLVQSESKHTLSLPEIVELPRFAALILLSDFLAPFENLATLVHHFASLGVRGHLVQVHDPAEEDLPYIGRTRFEGLEGEGTLTIGRTESLRADYQRKIAERRAQLEDLARLSGWSFITHRTDRSPQTALLALYTAIAGNRQSLASVRMI